MSQWSQICYISNLPQRKLFSKSQLVSIENEYEHSIFPKLFENDSTRANWPACVLQWNDITSIATGTTFKHQRLYVTKNERQCIKCLRIVA